jgi:transposase
MPTEEAAFNVQIWLLPDNIWEQIVPLLPLARRKRRMGRPRMNDRAAMNAILYRLKTGCAWKALPRSLGASSTIYDRFQEWREAGLFERLRQIGVLEPKEFELVGADEPVP